MRNKNFIDKAEDLIDSFKGAVRKSPLFTTSLSMATGVLGLASFSVDPSVLPEANQMLAAALASGGAGLGAVLLTKWAVNNSDKAKDLRESPSYSAAYSGKTGLRHPVSGGAEVSNSPYRITDDEKAALGELWDKYYSNNPSRGHPLIMNGVRVASIGTLTPDGHHESQFNLGRAYLNGEGVEVDYEKALALLESSTIQGNKTAPYVLFQVYSEGLVVEKDEKKAVALLELSCERRSVMALTQLGKLYENGELGFEKDLASADRCYEYAKMSGGGGTFFMSKKSSRELGLNRESFSELTRKADHQDPQAHYKLAMLWYSGVQLPRSAGRVEMHLSAAVQGGNASAKNVLGQLYLTGEIGKQDAVKGLSLLNESAEQGNHSALLKLAELYDAGKYVECNPELAQEYRSRVADPANPVDVMPKDKSSDSADEKSKPVSAIDAFYASNGYSAGGGALSKLEEMNNDLVAGKRGPREYKTLRMG